MTSLDLAFLPRLYLRVEAPSGLAPAWPAPADEGGGLSLGAKLCLQPAASLRARAPGACPLEAREPALGWYRLVQSEPLVVDCALGDNPRRAADTAIRLCMLLWIWARGGLLLHAAGLARDGRAAVALAPSGGGKSTLTDLAQGFESLSDETVAVLPTARRRGTGFEVWGTPFRSSAAKPPVSSAVLPLSAVLLLDKAAQPRWLPASGQEAARALIGQAYTALPAAGAPQALLRRAARLTACARAVHFQFPKSSAADALLGEIFADAESTSRP